MTNKKRFNAILIMPFNNMLSNKNHDWMSESISENLEAKNLKSGRFAVMEATLLRKVNPDIECAHRKATEGFY